MFLTQEIIKALAVPSLCRCLTGEVEDLRKLLVLDQQRAYLGGFNLSEDSSQHTSGGGRWRDTHVRIEGPFAAQAREAFDAFWSNDLRWQPSQVGPNLLMTNASHPARHHLRVALHTACLQARPSTR